MESKDVIFLSMHLPSARVPEAGQNICLNNLNNYIKNKKNVYLISFYNENEEQYIDELDYSGCQEFKLYKINNLTRLKGLFLKPFLPPVVAFRYSRDVEKKIIFYLKKYPKALLHIEYMQGVIYNPIWHRNTNLVLHDIISQSYFRYFDLEKNKFKKYFFKFLFYCMKKWEGLVFKENFKFVVLNNKDKDILKNEYDVVDTNILVNYPKVSDKFYNCQKKMRNTKNIMFWGAMNRFENEDAVLWFVENVFPLILDKYNDVNFFIVGANPSEKIISLQNENITVTGFVENPLYYFEVCSICVVPLRLGAGIKIKVLEALAAEMSVVTTSIGAEGVEDTKSLLNIFDDPLNFARAVLNIIDREDFL